MTGVRDIKDQLNPGEEVLHVAGPTLLSLLPLALLDGVFVILALVFWRVLDSSTALVVWLVPAIVTSVLLVVRWVPLRMTRYVLTSRRLVRESGLFTRVSVDSYLDKINNVDHRQTLLGRMLGYGDLEIDTASETGTTSFRRVNNPGEFKKAILSAREHLRDPAPVRAETNTAAAERLRQLSELLESGTITPDEFKEKRAQILGEL